MRQQRSERREKACEFRFREVFQTVRVCDCYWCFPLLVLRQYHPHPECNGETMSASFFIRLDPGVVPGPNCNLTLLIWLKPSLGEEVHLLCLAQTKQSVSISVRRTDVALVSFFEKTTVVGTSWSSYLEYILRKDERANCETV